MKRALLTGSLLALSLLAALPAQAQEKPVVTSKDRPDTVKITVTGEVDLQYVWRRDEITTFTGGAQNLTPPADVGSQNTLEGFVALRMNMELSDKVSTVIEVGTKQADGGALSIFAASNGAGGT